ncbi:hypothetical protein HYV81_06045 [Candidatus Woesearchaeota archaeon]|nr:hypothetical protein [Candidatus Woesearchaeota archaeon]
MKKPIYMGQGPTSDRFREPISGSSEPSTFSFRNLVIGTITTLGALVVTAIPVSFVIRGYEPVAVAYHPGENPTAQLVYRSGRFGQPFPVEKMRVPEVLDSTIGAPAPYQSGLGVLVADCKGASSTRLEISNALTAAYRADPGLFTNYVEVPLIPQIIVTQNQPALIARDPACVTQR